MFLAVHNVGCLAFGEYIMLMKSQILRRTRATCRARYQSSRLILRTAPIFYLLLNLIRTIIPSPPPLLPPSKSCVKSPDTTAELPGCKFNPLNIPVSVFRSVRAMNARVVFGTGCTIWLGVCIFRHMNGA